MSVYALIRRARHPVYLARRALVTTRGRLSSRERLRRRLAGRFGLAPEIAERLTTRALRMTDKALSLAPHHPR